MNKQQLVIKGDFRNECNKINTRKRRKKGKCGQAAKTAG